jgi:hypothetical protein
MHGEMTNAHKPAVRKPQIKKRRGDAQLGGQRDCQTTECEDVDCIRLTQYVSGRGWTALD